MIYNTSILEERQRADKYFAALCNRGKVVEVKARQKRRTLPQNAYAHILFTMFGIHFGYTIDEAKTLLKRECDFMRYQKNGEWFLKKTSKMEKDELSSFIDWIRNYAGQRDCYLPSSDEYIEKQFKIDKEIEAHKQYL